MRLSVDGNLCRGHGRCYSVAPNLLTYDDEGYSNARGLIIDVPADQLDEAHDAAGSCPEQAIDLLEATGDSPG